MFAIAILGACSGSDATAPRGPATVLMPLSAGSRWIYAEYDSVEFGPQLPVSFPSRDTVSVRQDTVIAGEHWALVDNGGLLLDDQYGESILLTDRQDGLYRFEALPPALGSPPFATTEMEFPYPVALHQRFGMTGAWVVANTDTVVTVPAGSFHCIRYDHATQWDPPATESVFIAPGTGIVMKVSFPSTGTDGSGQLISIERFVLRLTSIIAG